MNNMRLKTRSRAWRMPVVIFLAALTLNASAFGQTPSVSEYRLSFDKSLERKIKKGDLHQYRFSLRQGQVLFVELTEQTFDVKVELVKASDKTGVATANLGSGLERETLIFVAEETGEYLLRIDPSENQFGGGSYRFSARSADALTEKDKTRIEALRLLSEAATLQKENTAVNIREAIAKREQALALWQRIGDRYWGGRTLDRLATAHNVLLENNKAIDYINRALEIVKASGDRPLEAATLNTIGSMMSGFGEYKQATEYHSQALQIFQKAKNNVGVMNSLMSLGNDYAGLKYYPKANEYYQKSLALAQKEKNENFEAACLYVLGAVLDAQNEKPKALEKYDQALALWREMKNNGGIAIALLKIGPIQTLQGEKQKGLENLNEALKLFQSQKNRIHESDTYSALSNFHYSEGKFAEAIEFSKKALAYHQEFKIRLWEIILTGMIASYYENIPDYKEAIKYAEMALATDETAPERWAGNLTNSVKDQMRILKALTLQTLGRVYFNLGNAEKALRYYYQVLGEFEKKGDDNSKKRVMDSIHSIAQIHQYRYEWDKALENYNRGLVISQELNDKFRIILTLNSIGLIYSYTGDKKKALEPFTKALEGVRLIPDRGDLEKNFEASILNNIGQSHLFSGEPKKALEYYNQALAIQQGIKDLTYVDSRAMTYSNIAGVYAFLGENERAIELLNKALELYRQAPQRIKDLARNRTVEASLLNNLGVRYKETGNIRKALEYYDQALKLAIATKREGMEATALNNIALVYQAFGEPRKALQNLNRALELIRKTGAMPSESTIPNNIGQVYSDLGDERESIKYTNQGLEIAEKIGDKEAIATCLNNIGRAYTVLSENEKALNYINRALAISRETGNKNGELLSLNNLANLSSSTGERGKSIDYFEQALSIARGTGEKANEATILGNIAVDYLELGETQTALEHRERSLKVSREIGDKLGEIYQLNGIGAIYRRMGEQNKNPEHFKQALIHNEQALRLSRETESKRNEADALLGIGKVYIELNETAKAWPVLNEVLDYSKKYQNRYFEDAVHLALGKLHEKNREFDKAAEAYQQAMIVARAIADKDIEAKALQGLMSAWRARGNESLAIFYGKQSVNKYQQLRGSIRTLKRETQEVYREKVTDAYRELANLLIGRGRLPEAQAVLDLLKEAEFRQLQVTRASDNSGNNPDTIPYNNAEAGVIAHVEKLAALASQQIELEKERGENGALPGDKRTQFDQLIKEIEAANRAFRLSLEALGNSASDVEVKIEEINIARALQTEMKQLRSELKTGVAALYTVIGTEKTKNESGQAGKAKSKFGWIILVTPEGRKAYPIDVAGLEGTVSEFRAALSSDRYDPRPLAQKLYDRLFRQTSARQNRTLEADLETYFGRYADRTLMWSLDDVLRYVPMAALHDGKAYLVEKYRHVVFTGKSRRLTDKDSAKWKALGLGVSEAKTVDNRSFGALQGAKREIRDIVREQDGETGILEGTRRLDTDFTKEAALRLWREGSHQVIHIASHYVFNPVDRRASFLLTGDGKLTFDELQDKDNLFGAVDLLTLSACDTATGGASGEEAEGFAFLAQELGAKSVIASLWKVSDAATPELMVLFYKLRADNPAMSKGEAFRRAQFSLLGKEAKSNGNDPSLRGPQSSGRKIGLPYFVKDAKNPFAHPHYWASFILIGNWR